MKKVLILHHRLDSVPLARTPCSSGCWGFVVCILLRLNSGIRSNPKMIDNLFKTVKLFTSWALEKVNNLIMK